MAKLDTATRDHLEWLGYVQPTGLVVSAPALVRAGAVLAKNDTEGQRLLRSVTHETTVPAQSEPALVAPDFETFARTVLGWKFSPRGYAGTADRPIPDDLIVQLHDHGETLAPDYAVIEREPNEDENEWQLLVNVLEPGEDMQQSKRKGGNLEISEHSRLERLLRQTGVPAGLLFNGRVLRLISAPRGESSGWMDFDVAAMTQTPGRPIVAALRLLLSEQTLLAKPKNARLAALLAESRKYQNDVSEKLAEQVLHALYELLRGLQTAHDASHGELLKDPLERDPDQIYRALLTTILRLVFLLYAEERDMLPEDDTFIQHYSIASLHERLREDAGLHPDTMDQRFGAWAQLLVLFRLVYDGADAGDLRLPERHGELFDPDRFPFLEGRPADDSGADPHMPLVPDGTVYRALEHLLVLEGERISYRALDVEQIGSVYETMMGFRIERAEGRSLAVRSSKPHGAPTIVDVDALLATEPKSRTKWLNDQLDRPPPPKALKAISEAGSVTNVHHALDRLVDRRASPDIIPRGALVLQPSDERRRSGSHYTPRELTEPIVRATLEPILNRLDAASSFGPSPDAILDLKVCDPAMGSGAFLVEACRQLGDALVEAWATYDEAPTVPADEDKTVFARRLIAQRCLYGVDRNPVAVDLAKVSIWLVTLARQHPLTFLDHALRFGDSLVGLGKHELRAFNWKPGENSFAAVVVDDSLKRGHAIREQIRTAPDAVTDATLRQLWGEANEELKRVRLYGDLVVNAFFGGRRASERESKLVAYSQNVISGSTDELDSEVRKRRLQDPPLAPFHWHIEFPEVFERATPGFDVVVGNPPFAGKNTLAGSNVESYADWLKAIRKGIHGNADLVAHFFRRSFELLRSNGTFGLIATNTIGQGDTRSTGLTWIVKHGGQIYRARKRVKWPGRATVVVSVVHVLKDSNPIPSANLDGHCVPRITAFLVRLGPDDDPAPLRANSERAFVGNYVLGDGFIFDDSNSNRWPVSKALSLLSDEHNAAVVRPYLTGAQVNGLSVLEPHLYVIDFGNRTQAEARTWPDVFSLVEERVEPKRKRYSGATAKNWWQHARTKARFYTRIRKMDRIIVTSQTSTHWGFTFADPNWTLDQTVTCVATDDMVTFAVLSSRVHEIWARLVGASLEDRLRYTPSDCFDPFPFPGQASRNMSVAMAGQAYYDYRAGHMEAEDLGLTALFNRFHDPSVLDSSMETLRTLQDSLDRAVLGLYGWEDVEPVASFRLDFEIDEDAWGRKKKPYRYRWPDHIQDEVLARLLELNKKRAAEEARTG